MNDAELHKMKQLITDYETQIAKLETEKALAIAKIQADHDRLMKYQAEIGAGCIEFGGIWKEIHALKRVLKWLGEE